MPSESGKRKAKRIKSTQITDCQGWTHIVRGPRSRVDHAKDVSSQLQNLRLGVPLSITQVSAQQENYLQSWTQSQCRRDLQLTLEDSIFRLSHLYIDNCVCLGLGSFTSHRESPKHQLATLFWMLDIIKSKHTIARVILQDPAFTRSDIAYLEGLGHAVVGTPEAFHAIGRSTFLFAPHLERNVYATALDGEVPAICVGSDVEALLDQTISATEKAKHLQQNEAFQRFHNAASSNVFSPYDKDSWWYFTRIYWQKGSKDT